MPDEQHTFQSGAVIDTRTDEQKLKDFKFEEIVAAANPVNWVEKPQASWRHFPIFNQDGSGSCVAQTLAKLLGVLYWLKNGLYVHFSATHIYQRRSNKPAGGMAGVDAFNIAKAGVTLEELVPSQNMTDSQMDGVVIPQYKQDVGGIFKIPNYVSLPVKDIETIASVIQTTQKAVMVWFYFQSNEWTEHPTVINPNLDLNAAATARHSVAAVDFTLVNGKKCLIIDDSWGTSFGPAGERVIDEDFFKARNWFAAYPIAFVFDDQSQPQPQPQPTPTPKPMHHFNVVLEFGQTSADITALQNILRYEGFFPTNVASTGYYGAVTAAGVLKWQIKHNVAPLAELNSLQGRRVGDKTIKKLNELYV
jgi:hypothetical protein